MVQNRTKPGRARKGSTPRASYSPACPRALMLMKVMFPPSLLRCILITVMVGAIEAATPVRFYTFDFDGDWSDKGSDGVPLTPGDPALFTHTSVDCLDNHGDCITINAHAFPSLSYAFRTSTDWSTYTNGMSICYWFKAPAALKVEFMQTGIGGSPCSTPQEWLFFMMFGNWMSSWQTGPTTFGSVGNPALLAPGWSHVCHTWAPTGFRSIWVDGVKTTFLGPSFGPADVPMPGNRDLFFGTACKFPGDELVIDSIQIFDEVLDAAGVAEAAGPWDVDECQQEAQAEACHKLAYCENTVGSYLCTCPEGFLGNGMDCSSSAWGVRSVCKFPDATAVDHDALRLGYARAITGEVMVDGVYNINEDTPIVRTAHIEVHPTGNLLTVNALFETKNDADNALALMDPAYDWTVLQGCTLVDGPDVYAWTGQSTSDPLLVGPSGFTVDGVYFDSSCLDSGCWVVDVTYTTGTADFNVFYIPRAEGNDGLSYDFDYGTKVAPWSQSAADTFEPKTHPCTSADYDAGDGLLAQVTSCCLHQFLAMYRPIDTFIADVAGKTGNCSDGVRDRTVSSEEVYKFGYREMAGDPNAPYGVYVDSRFENLTSYGEPMGVVDPYIGIFKARFYLDEVELRRQAGQLTGTVGVEHTVDTFLGLINLSPTNIHVLDTFATQTAIHLEKTSFFTVSTHGTNAYTFLEYVNLRLIAVYLEDVDFSGTDEEADRTVRTASTGQINYVQVTFTLGAQYKVDNDPDTFPLIPLDSVRAGHGTFFGAASDLTHKCSEFVAAPRELVFNDTLLDQPCAPSASMCESPASIPDSFVSFNIPLGTNYFETAGGASDTAEHNIFVDMVISAVEATGGRPNQGDDPHQMKTTLTASIPIVEGGVNVFCDGFTAKTDLKDVADADIVIGSASTADELTRLRIVSNVASTALAERGEVQIDSDSMEAGLMTLVLKGNSSYFARRRAVTMELEDVITIHIMEEDGSGGGVTDSSIAVDSLLSEDPQDNSLGGELDTDGYHLNGAFRFTIDRAAQRAHLEPTAALLALCPFNPPRPDPAALQLETCVTRRDVQYRGFPAKPGAKSTAIEICTAGGATVRDTDTCPSADQENSREAAFFESVLGSSQYARRLGSNFAREIAARYNLNGAYRRAYFINPGYEWTPTQTGGTPIFSVSQKLYLFALITLDEGIVGVAAGESGDAPSLRRRMLLQSTPSTVGEALQDGQAAAAGSVVEFATSPASLMAKTFGVAEDLVATFAVRLQLTEREACLATNTERQLSIRDTMEDYLAGATSPLHSVQITQVAVDMGGVLCARRAARSLLSSSAFSAATAEVTLLLVFKDVPDAGIELFQLRSRAGVVSAEPLSVSPLLASPTSDWGSAPPSWEEDAHASFWTTAWIAGAAGGGAALLAAVGVGAMVLRRRRHDAEETLYAVQTVDIQDLKLQLEADLAVVSSRSESAEGPRALAPSLAAPVAMWPERANAFGFDAHDLS